MRINDLVGKDVVFYVGADTVLVNIEDINSSGFICKVKSSKCKWYTVNEEYFIPIATFILHIQQ